ncbi:MAG: 7TM domain-containing protein [Microgenomates group bacterium]
MRKVSIFVTFIVAAGLTFAVVTNIFAQSLSPIGTASPSAELEVEPTPAPRPDLTQQTEETIGPLEKLLEEQELGPVWPTNPIKYAIRGAVNAGVSSNTIVLLLLLPVSATVIAATRHLIGLKGFGIFLPAALSVVFISTGPIVGIGLFLIIVFVSTAARMILRKTKIKLQYLPKMALILWFVVLGVLGLLFAAPLIQRPDLTNVSIFSVLVLVLLAEDFSKVQIGKSVKTAVNLTTETLILSLVSYMFLTLKPLQEYAFLNPEILLVSVAIFDILIGRYVGLRFMELWRFRRLISD